MNGLNNLKDELKKLLQVERPKTVEVVAWAAGNGDRSENGDYIYGKKRLREIDRRIRFLTKRIESAQVVDPASQPKDKVLFGAKVSVRDESDELKTIQIVGEDEINTETGKISWKSPYARALLGKTIDDEATVKKPSGEIYVTIEKIDYPSDS